MRKLLFAIIATISLIAVSCQSPSTTDEASKNDSTTVDSLVIVDTLAVDTTTVK